MWEPLSSLCVAAVTLRGRIRAPAAASQSAQTPLRPQLLTLLRTPLQSWKPNRSSPASKPCSSSTPSSSGYVASPPGVGVRRWGVEGGRDRVFPPRSQSILIHRCVSACVCVRDGGSSIIDAVVWICVHAGLTLDGFYYICYDDQCGRFYEADRTEGVCICVYWASDAQKHAHTHAASILHNPQQR